jgi:single-strand DNA-binding protein
VSASINRVILVGNLTRDPETRQAGTSTVCSLRLAVNDRVKDRTSGEWTDYANYVDVTVFGAQGEHCAQWLAKGRQVAIDGHLRWRAWNAKDGSKHEAVSVVADNVQFIGPREGGAPRASSPASASTSDVATAECDDDIPF